MSITLYHKRHLIYFMVFVVLLCTLLLMSGPVSALGDSIANIGGTDDKLKGALTLLDGMAPSVKGLICFIMFCVAFISLAALRNFSPVLFYIGGAIFGAVGLTVGLSIMGAVV